MFTRKAQINKTKKIIAFDEVAHIKESCGLAVSNKDVTVEVELELLLSTSHFLARSFGLISPGLKELVILACSVLFFTFS